MFFRLFCSRLMYDSHKENDEEDLCIKKNDQRKMVPRKKLRNHTIVIIHGAGGEKHVPFVEKMTKNDCLAVLIYHAYAIDHLSGLTIIFILKQ